MANRENMKPSEVDAPNAAQVEFSANPRFLAPQTKHFLQAQERILGEMEKFSSNWFQRRQEATRSMIEAGRKILSEGQTDPAGAIKKITEWQTHSMERLAEDAKACTEMMTNCTGAFVQNEVEAIEETAEVTQKSAKTSKSTPV